MTDGWTDGAMGGAMEACYGNARQLFVRFLRVPRIGRVVSGDLLNFADKLIRRTAQDLVQQKNTLYA